MHNAICGTALLPLSRRSKASQAAICSGIVYPCRKDDLVEHARQNHADHDVIETLEALPEGAYTNMVYVMKGYGEERGHSA
jgi:hypothetical protein